MSRMPEGQNPLRPRRRFGYATRVESDETDILAEGFGTYLGNIHMKHRIKNISRRRFLMAASTAVAASTLGIPNAETAPADQSVKSGIKITDLKVIRSDSPGRVGWNWIFAKLETDSGIYGWGRPVCRRKMQE